MTQGKITEVKKGTVIATGERFLDVTVDIYEGELDQQVLVDTKKFGYPLETTTEEIKADIDKHLALREAEKTQAAAQAETDAAEQAGDDTAGELVGLEVTR